MKDLASSETEIASQKARIQAVRDDPEKDEHDVKKQEEVLEEYLSAVPNEQTALCDYYDGLEQLMNELKDDVDICATEEFSKAQEALTAARPILQACGKLDD